MGRPLLVAFSCAACAACVAVLILTRSPGNSLTTRLMQGGFIAYLTPVDVMSLMDPWTMYEWHRTCVVMLWNMRKLYWIGSS